MQQYIEKEYIFSRFLILEAWEAFNNAHHNMDSIQISMQQIPSFIKEALTILYRGSPNGVKHLLPSALKNIEIKSERVLTLATETHTKFANVMLLIGEVVEASGQSQGISETKLRETQIEINMTRLMLDESLKMKELILKEFEQVRSKLKETEQKHVEALKEIPTGFKAIFQDFTHRIFNGLATIITEGVKNLFFGPDKSIGSLTGSQTKDQKNPDNQASFSDNTGTKSSTTFGKIFSDKMNEMLPIVDKNFGQNAKFSAKSGNEFETYKKGFEFLFSTIQKLHPSDTINRTKILVNKGIRLTGKAVNLIKKTTALFNGKRRGASKKNETIKFSLKSNVEQVEKQPSESDSESSEQLKDEFHELADQAKPYSVAETLKTGESSSNDFSNDHTPTGNAKYLAAVALERLREAEKRYDKRFEEFKQAQEQCSKLMIKIASLDYTRIDFHEIIDVLREVLRILGDVREQWSKLIQFFGHLQVLIKNELDITQSFIRKGKQTIKHPSLLQTDFQLVKELLRKQTIGMHKSTYLVFIISRTYVDVSRKYVVTQVAGLSKFLAAATDEERNRMKNDLYQATQRAQQEITSFVNERRLQYHSVINHRRMELDAFLEQLGGITENDQALLENGKRIEGLD